ncbi:MAG: hypothetical protein LBM93_10885 [Oscillospiraceae bacterium]|nr:hypothetical protein [Oscillospiraceae bacterium]
MSERNKNANQASTLGIYSRYLDTYIIPYFGNTRCDKLTVEMLQNFANKLLENDCR